MQVVQLQVWFVQFCLGFVQGFGSCFGYKDFIFVVLGWDVLFLLQLMGDVLVVDVVFFQLVVEYIVEVFWEEVYFVCFYCFQCCLGKVFYFEELLQCQVGFYDGVGLFRMADFVVVVFVFYQVFVGFEVFNDQFVGFEVVFVYVKLCCFVYGVIGIQDVDDFQFVVFVDFVIVYVVGRGDFKGICIKFYVYIVVFNNWDGVADQWYNSFFVFEVGEVFIVWVDGNCGIVQDSFGVYGCNCDVCVFCIFDFIVEVVQFGVFVFVDDFFVGQYGLCFWVLVGYVQFVVDFVFVVEVYEYFEYGFGKFVFYCEVGMFLVVGSIQFFELIEDDIVVFVFLFKGVFYEFVVVEV